MLTFNDFLNTKLEDSQTIFAFYLNFLGELSIKTFPYDEQLKLSGAARKFTNAVRKTSYVQDETIEIYSNHIGEFLKHLRSYRRIETHSFVLQFIMNSNRKRRLFKIQDSFQDLYSNTLELISEATDKTMYFDSLKINDFYKPDKSNKHKIKELIIEAADIIKVDSSLTEQTKKSIIDYLNNALNELERERVNWSVFLGKIKETVIVLGALGSLVGGASALYNAQKKLEQTTIIIQNTSANINYNVLSQTFNVHNIQHIESLTQLLELPENNQSQNTEEPDSGNEETAMRMEYSTNTALPPSFK